MDPMDFTIEELENMIAEQDKVVNEAIAELKRLDALYAERLRLEKLKASLGNISADDIAKIQALLGPSSIETSEDVNVT